MKQTAIFFLTGAVLLASCGQDLQMQQAEATRQFYLQGQGMPEESEISGELNNLTPAQKTKIADKLKEKFPGVDLEEAKKKYEEMKDDPKVQQLKEKLLSDIGS